jgi:hypothetical protein
MRIEFDVWCEAKRRETADHRLTGQWVGWVSDGYRHYYQAVQRVLAAHPGCTAATCVTIAAIDNTNREETHHGTQH